MAHSFLIFDFGNKEDAAQQARHRIEGWKQAFRLDKKLQVKFERQEPEAKEDGAPAQESTAAKSAAKAKGKSAGKGKSGSAAAAKPATAVEEASQIRLIVRLDFSDHEKLSHQRWLERIPAEEPFKTGNPKIIRAGDSEFQATEDLFDLLD